MKSIDLNALTLQDALDLAILIEQEAAERYGELADQMEIHHTPSAAEFFRMMVGYEERHRDELQARRRKLFGAAASNVDTLMIWEVEAPEYDTVRAFMSRREALAVALQSEKKAYAFFASAASRIGDAEARGLFEELQKEEILHQELVQKQIDALPGDDEAGAADLADEPVAQ